ncbi:MAG: XRE family transcriptional regulator [Gordonibacter sp.]|uniref:LexA family transcriptional regulator n=1 Tax=Gordonibacter sp. TaxID=1968902 RepID=UPI002FCC3CF7
MGVAENIDALLVKFDITADSLARIAEVQPPTVSRWRRGVMPREEPIKKIADFFNLKRDDIVSDSYGLAAKEHGTIPTLPPNAIIPTVVEDAYLPLRGRVHAGNAQEPDSIEGEVIVSKTLANRHPKGYFLEVEGDCMDKVYPEGCHVLIDPDKEPQNGSVAVVSIDSADYVMRRLLRTSSTMVLSPESFNDEHEDVIITADSGHTVELIGTVVWFQPSEEME